MTNSKRLLLPTPLVLSLLSGATQVSVPVKPQPWYVSNWRDDLPDGFVVDENNGYWRWGYGCWPENRCMTGDVMAFAERLAEHCPFPVGTEVWVPETWIEVYREWPFPDEVCYKADVTHNEGPWLSPITMPSWAARLRYIVEGVKVGRVQEMSEADYKAEGVIPVMVDSGGQQPWGEWIDIPEYRDPFATRWNAAYPDYPWGGNPWRYTYTLRRL